MEASPERSSACAAPKGKRRISKGRRAVSSSSSSSTTSLTGAVQGAAPSVGTEQLKLNASANTAAGLEGEAATPKDTKKAKKKSPAKKKISKTANQPEAPAKGKGRPASQKRTPKKRSFEDSSTSLDSGTSTVVDLRVTLPGPSTSGDLSRIISVEPPVASKKRCLRSGSSDRLEADSSVPSTSTAAEKGEEPAQKKKRKSSVEKVKKESAARTKRSYRSKKTGSCASSR